MFWSLAFSALLMGLAGGPHCAAMCGAACATIARNARGPRGMASFQMGRLLGYSAAGAGGAERRFCAGAGSSGDGERGQHAERCELASGSGLRLGLLALCKRLRVGRER